jgi:hypothetical protein
VLANLAGSCYDLSITEIEDIAGDKQPARKWSKTSATIWTSSDGWVIEKTPRRRIGRNGFRVAGYELRDPDGVNWAFFTKLGQAKEWA